MVEGWLSDEVAVVSRGGMVTDSGANMVKDGGFMGIRYMLSILKDVLGMRDKGASCSSVHDMIEFDRSIKGHLNLSMKGSCCGSCYPTALPYLGCQHEMELYLSYTSEAGRTAKGPS